MKHTIVTLAQLVLISAVLATPVASKGEKKTGHNAPETEVIKRVYDVGKNARLSLANLNGTATITGWDKNTIEVTATKRANARERLADATVQFDLLDDHLRVEVVYDFGHGDDFNGNDGLVSVDFEIRVPRHVDIRRVELVNGGIDVSDLTGDVRVSSVNGDVMGEKLSGETRLSTVNGDVSLSSVKGHDSIELSSVNGSVTLYLPPNANAKLSASTVHGDIRGDLGHGVTHAGSSIDAVLGNGGPRIGLGTVNGDIRIRRAGSEQRGDVDDDSD
ncbi:MAG TPA: DUF4097 family beta strand repeat-containing protein [Candidatus Krumholzibacteria bacterium]|nr:DUF4097 family beta strand repeat-containing protein [Candidatus Krumholzibacteria bacterium]